MTNGEFMATLVRAAKEYTPNALASVARNDHMNALLPTQQPMQAQAEAVVVDFINYVGMQRGLDMGMYTLDLPPVPAAAGVAQSGWVSCANLSHTLHHEFLYVLLPDGTVTQAMYQDFFTDEIEGMAWGHYTDVDVIESLPVQPTHFFTPPAPPANA